MIQLLKNSFKEKEIRKRIFFTLGILIVFRLGTFITVPGVNAKGLETVASSGIFGLLDTFGGGALNNFSIFAMGVSPYITASIVIQLLQMDIVPRFVEWSKQGEVGRRKLNQATRYLTIILAFVQSLGVTAMFNNMSKVNIVKNPSTFTYFSIGLILAAGTMFVTWLGEQMTEKGIGNGISMIIFSGIVAKLPSGIHQIYVEYIKTIKNNTDMWKAIGFITALVVAVIVIVIVVTYVQQANRRIPIQYTRRVTGTGQNSYLPLKVNAAGVIPVIFASSFIALPQTIMGFFQGAHSEDTWYKVMNTIFNYKTAPGATVYTVLIILFTFFYAFVQVNPEKVAENLTKQGSYIPSVRPGKGTEQYISKMLMRLSTVGSIFLGAVSLIPIIASNVWNLPQSIGLGGTSLLIIIGVALDSMKQLEGLSIKRKYVGFIR